MVWAMSVLWWSGKALIPVKRVADGECIFQNFVSRNSKWTDIINSYEFERRPKLLNVYEDCQKPLKTFISDQLTKSSEQFKFAYLNKIKNGSVLLERKRFNPIKTIQCAYHNTPGISKEIPTLLYIQNPLIWAANKLDFRYLRTSWDPVFTEQEFKRGARQAISTITQLISQNMFDSLNPLLTKKALINLRQDVEILWADEIKRNIGLEPEDVQLIIPRKLHFKKDSEEKFCDIDVVFIVLKFLESRNDNPPLAFIDIIARFHRNYTDGIAPDWTVSAFKVRRFNALSPK